LYRRRLVLLNRASWLAAVALLCLLSAVLAGCLSLVYPPLWAIKAVGTTGLFFGLLLMAAAVSLDLIERILARHEIEEEVADLDDEARRGPRRRRPPGRLRWKFGRPLTDGSARPGHLRCNST
jgi:hypothetical protein